VRTLTFPPARLFAPDKYGGYLIYRSNGRMKVFFDGRSDLYGAEFLKQYGRMVQLRPGWREYWDSFHFTHALAPVDAPLGPALEQIGWRELYRDKTAVLLATIQAFEIRLCLWFRLLLGTRVGSMILWRNRRSDPVPATAPPFLNTRPTNRTVSCPNSGRTSFTSTWIIPILSASDWKARPVTGLPQ
jgi:hypothetical protein